MPGFKWHECPRCQLWFDCDLAPTYFTRDPNQKTTIQSAGSVTLTSPFDSRPGINIKQKNPTLQEPSYLTTPPNFTVTNPSAFPFGLNVYSSAKLETSAPNTSGDVHSLKELPHVSVIKTEKESQPDTEDWTAPLFNYNPSESTLTVKAELIDPVENMDTSQSKVVETCLQTSEENQNSQGHKAEPILNTNDNSESQHINETCDNFRESNIKVSNKNASYQCTKCSKMCASRKQLLVHKGTHSEKKFHCLTCNMPFRLKKQLISHKKTHKKALPHACPLCPRKYLQKHSLKEHLMRFHKKRYRCKNCSGFYATEQEYEKHFENQTQCKKPKFDCCVCGQIFIDRDDLLKHHKVHRDMVGFKCRKCKKEYAHINSLWSHMRSHEIGEKMCPHCGKLVINNSSLKNHIAIVHSDERPFSCTLCPRRFKFKSDVKSHMESRHTQSVRFQCEVCSASYTSRLCLNQHLKKHVTEYPYECFSCPFKSATRSPYEKHVEVAHPGVQPYPCDLCPASGGFALESHLRDHLREVHGRTDLSQDFHRCGVCGFNFIFKWRLEIHMLRHQDREFRCTLCPSKYKTKQRLEKHCAEKHPDGKRITFSCEKCGRELSSKKRLARHMESVHLTEKCIQCKAPGCLKVFKVIADMESHFKLVHIGDKPHKCSECPKAFPTLSKLRNHFRIHSGEKPFHCTQCNYSCNTAGNLKKHTNVHKK